jgi:hypothetical protein
MLTLLHDSTLHNRLLPQKKILPSSNNKSLTAGFSRKRRDYGCDRDRFVREPCGMITSLDKSKYRRTPRMITEQSHFCGIKDSLIRLKVVLQGLLPVTESRLENT